MPVYLVRVATRKLKDAHLWLILRRVWGVENDGGATKLHHVAPKLHVNCAQLLWPSLGSNLSLQSDFEEPRSQSAWKCSQTKAAMQPT